MWKVMDILWLFILLILSVIDVKERQVPGYLIGGVGTGSIIYHLITGGQDILLLLGGVAIGCFFIFISKITEEGLGYGDSYGILMMGIYLGAWKVLTVLVISFFLLLCTTIPLMWMKKMNRKITFPFYPFLAGGYAFLLFMGG